MYSSHLINSPTIIICKTTVSVHKILARHHGLSGGIDEDDMNLDKTHIQTENEKVKLVEGCKIMKI